MGKFLRIISPLWIICVVIFDPFQRLHTLYTTCTKYKYKKGVGSLLIATELINIAVNDLNVKKSIGKRWVLPVTKLVLKEDQLYDLKQGLLA